MKITEIINDQPEVRAMNKTENNTDTFMAKKELGQEMMVGTLLQAIKDYRLLRQRKMVKKGKLNIGLLKKLGKKHIGGMGTKEIRETFRFIHGADFNRAWEMGDFELDVERARKQIIEGPIDPDKPKSKQ
jgi:hypothetical protein